MWKCLCSFFSPVLFPLPFAVLGCQAILVSDRNKSFRRGSVGQPLSSTKSSRIRSQRLLSPQPAGLGEIYCEERKKVVISWHFHDETWPKLCWLGGLEAHKECGCVWPSPSQSHYHWLTITPPSPRIISPSEGQAGLARLYLLPQRRPGFSVHELWPLHFAHQSSNSHNDLRAPNKTPFWKLRLSLSQSAVLRVASERQGPGAAGLITKTWVFCIKDLGGEVNEKLLDLSPSCSV